jgi:hypothetical protein
VKKLFGLVSWVCPGVRVASWTKSRPFNGRSGHFFRSDYLAEGCVRRFNRHFIRIDFDRRTDRGGIEREIDFELFVDLQADVFLLCGLEALRLHVDGVMGDGQQRHEVVSGVVGLGFARQAGFLRSDFHGCAGDDRAVLSATFPKDCRSLGCKEVDKGKTRNTEPLRAAPFF